MANKNEQQLAEAHIRKGNLCKARRDFDNAERAYAEAIQADPGNNVAHFLRGNILKLQGRVDDAINSYDAALRVDPGMIEAYWNKLRILPVILDNTQQLETTRENYSRALDTLEDSLSLTTEKGIEDAFRGIYTSTNFYLQYQGRDDRELQEKYASLIEKVMTARYPLWSVPREKSRPGPGGKIRVGYASAYLKANNGAQWMLGWLQHRDHKNFEIYCYHTGPETDEISNAFRQQSDFFYHIPDNLEKVCKKIDDDQLDILVYPELGMDAHTLVMAGLRLAPVQCVGWGHPITSGLKTMDYWISSDLMEPGNGQEHYSEKLIRLPNMAHCYSKEQHNSIQSTPQKRTRTDFRLREDGVLYLCGQSLFKYLPEDDHLLPDIAKKVSNAQFIFLAVSSVHVVRRFMARIDSAFQSAGLRAQDHCTMINRLPHKDFIALHQLVDVFLDNPSWSGNNTTLGAIDCELPVVTLPTEFMRGRHAYAILTMLGVTETIAGSRQEYVDIAVRLGTDKAWRQSIQSKIAAQKDRIYNDTSCVQALDEFYIKAAGLAK